MFNWFVVPYKRREILGYNINGSSVESVRRENVLCSQCYFSDLAKDYIYNKIWEAYPETDQKKNDDFIIFSDCIYGTITKTQNFAGLFGLDTFETHKTARNSWGDQLDMTFYVIN